MAIAKTQKAYTHRHLLRDLSEIKAVLEVESQLIQALVAMAIERQSSGLVGVF